ncbi:MAG TPA: GAF domain-containing protein [Ohtaekwangia sp.]|uniref:GAF domain-containing protein n=1 Tax=Ohtaekwangia sp. TaxID=2066019 RepID=UPI002F94CD4B
MRERIGQYIKENIVVLSISLIAMLLAVNIVLTFKNKETIVENIRIREEADATINDMERFSTYLNCIDLGVRAYGITKKREMLNSTYNAIKQLWPHFKLLEHRLDSGGQDISGLEKLEETFQDYVDFSLKMVAMVDVDSAETFKRMLSEDRGMIVWAQSQEIATKISAIEESKSLAAEESYQLAVRNNFYLQLILVVISFPTLVYIVVKMRNDSKGRQSLLTELDENNRKYVFNPGTATHFKSQQEVIEHSIRNLQYANKFIEHITSGNYETKWAALNDENKSFNETSLAGRLTLMRDQLKQIKSEENIRLWSNEGLNRISELVTNTQSDSKGLADMIVSFLTKYMGALQGGLFVLRGSNKQDEYLELIACYAYDRKKFVERKIDIGVGLVGQTFLEGRTTLLTKLPQGYTYITSGMGETTPSCVLIVPMKYNDKTEAIIEIAGLETFKEHQILFIEKAGEFIASALQSARTTEKMKTLLNASQQQAEEMRATEEELRQNMEELVATQEAMMRKQTE